MASILSNLFFEDTYDCKIIALDQDPFANKKAQEMAQDPRYKDRLIMVRGKVGQFWVTISVFTTRWLKCNMTRTCSTVW
jgi:hypothetical protein